MLAALWKALADVMSPEFRAVLWKALALTLALFIAVLVVVEVLLLTLTQFSWAWADWLLGLGTGLLLVVAFFFLMAPATAMFAGLFLDDIAGRVEARHYPADRAGTPLKPLRAFITGLQFAAVVLLVNLAVLPMVFLGIGAFVLVASNAYLLSREYFEMIAARHVSVAEARLRRKANAPRIFIAGVIPALLALVPIINLVVPLFATAYFVHIFKQAPASSA